METTCGLLVLSYLIVAVVGQTGTIQIIPANATASVGQNVTIICSNSRNNTVQTTPEIIGVPAMGRFIEVDSNSQIKTYIYLNVRREDNGIGFRCSFSFSGINSEPIQTNWINLTVLFPPIISNDNSVVTNGSVGNQATVTFTVDANPQVVANGVSINRAGADNIDVNGDQVTITFSNLMRSDAGDYMVTATNTEGSDNAAFSLNVFFGPIYIQQSSDTLINKTVGSNIILNCSVESNPPATVTFDTTAVARGNASINSIGIITITNATMDFAGDYTCSADNNKNITTLTYTVRIGNIPNIVLSYGMITYNMTHVLVPYTITMNNTFGSINQYTVSCANCPAGYIMRSFDPSSLPNPIEIPLNLLTCGTTYAINITATNEFGTKVVASGSFTYNNNNFCVTPSPSTSPTGDCIGLVGTTTAVLVVLLGIIAAVLVN